MRKIVWLIILTISIIGVLAACSPGSAQQVNTSTSPGVQAVTTSSTTSTELLVPPVGSPAPDFDLDNANGDRVSLSQFRGKLVLLMFVNPSTGGANSPPMNSYVINYLGIPRMEVLVISNVYDIPESARQTMLESAEGCCLMSSYQYGSPLLDEDGSVSRSYGAGSDSLTLVLVDLAGNIAYEENSPSDASLNSSLADAVNLALS